MSTMSITASCLLAFFSLSASAQQYAGDTISGTLPFQDGSEVAYFRISDPSGANDQLTLVNYYSHASNGQRIQESAVERAVIMMSGMNRNAGDYQGYVLDALNKVSSGPSIDNTVIMAPMFANEQDKGYAYPYDDGSQQSTSNALVWNNDDWAYGRNNIYPSSSTNISSFHVLDEVVAYFKDESNFPNLKEVVVAGHSMGSQLVQRYAALTSVDSDRIPVTFWPADPNSMVWLSTDRPQGPAVDCDTYDDYPEGFSNYANASQQYGQGLISQGREAILQNFQSKQISWLRSTKDQGDYTVDGCGAYASGSNRDERFLNFMNAFSPSCEDPTGGNCDTVDYIDSTHDAATAFGSDAGLARLFTDNFDGKGGRAYDFGARRTEGDSPYPGQ